MLTTQRKRPEEGQVGKRQAVHQLMQADRHRSSLQRARRGQRWRQAGHGRRRRPLAELRKSPSGSDQILTNSLIDCLCRPRPVAACGGTTTCSRLNSAVVRLQFETFLQRERNALCCCCRSTRSTSTEKQSEPKKRADHLCRAWDIHSRLLRSNLRQIKRCRDACCRLQCSPMPPTTCYCLTARKWSSGRSSAPQSSNCQIDRPARDSRPTVQPQSHFTYRLRV
jgi:hypothetical protein